MIKPVAIGYRNNRPDGHPLRLREISNNANVGDREGN